MAPACLQAAGPTGRSSRNSLPALSAAAVVQVKQLVQCVLRKRETAAAGRLEDTPALTAQPEQRPPELSACVELTCRNSERHFQQPDRHSPCLLKQRQLRSRTRGDRGGIISPGGVRGGAPLSFLTPFHSIRGGAPLFLSDLHPFLSFFLHLLLFSGEYLSRFLTVGGVGEIVKRIIAQGCGCSGFFSCCGGGERSLFGGLFRTGRP